MSYGFFAQNTTAVTIDDTFFNLAFRSKGTVTTSSNYGVGTGTMFYGDLSLPTSSAIVAFRSSTAVFSSMNGAESAAGTIRVYSNIQDAAIEYFIFDLPTEGSGTHGMLVWNEGQAITYDSRLKYLRMERVFSSPNYAAIQGTYALTPGRVFAAIFSTGYYRIVDDYQLQPGGTSPTGPWIHMITTSYSGIRFPGESVVISGLGNTDLIETTYGAPPHSQLISTKSDATINIIDVTGY